MTDEAEIRCVSSLAASYRVTLWILAFFIMPSLRPAEMTVDVKPAHDEYLVGEPISIKVTILNVEREDILIGFSYPLMPEFNFQDDSKALTQQKKISPIYLSGIPGIALKPNESKSFIICLNRYTSSPVAGIYNISYKMKGFVRKAAAKQGENADRFFDSPNCEFSGTFLLKVHEGNFDTHQFVARLFENREFTERLSDSEIFETLRYIDDTSVVAHIVELHSRFKRIPRLVAEQLLKYPTNENSLVMMEKMLTTDDEFVEPPSSIAMYETLEKANRLTKAFVSNQLRTNYAYSMLKFLKGKKDRNFFDRDAVAKILKESKPESGLYEDAKAALE